MHLLVGVRVRIPELPVPGDVIALRGWRHTPTICPGRAPVSTPSRRRVLAVDDHRVVAGRVDDVPAAIGGEVAHVAGRVGGRELRSVDEQEVGGAPGASVPRSVIPHAAAGIDVRRATAASTVNTSEPTR